MTSPATMIRRRSESKTSNATAPPKGPAPPKRSASYLATFPLPAPVTPLAARRGPLRMQHLGLAAVDAGYCCHEFTQLHLSVEWRLDRHVVGGVLENATGQPLFEVREKPLSLHRQRSLLDLTEVPVATIRMSAFRRRKATYSSYLYADTSKKPLLKFTMSRSKLEMTFTDIMTGEPCRLGSTGEQGDIEIWLQRGLSADTIKQPIVHMYLSPAGTPLGYSLDIAEGVDAVMAILVCIAVHDSEPDRKWRAPSAIRMDLHDVASQVQTLVALRHFVSAFDASQVASKPVQLRITSDAVVDVATSEKLFLIQQKQFSLHRQRTLLNARNELPVATLRLSMFNRKPTYSAYPRTEHEETPCAFKFTADDTTVRSEFTDLVGGQHCTIGCDPATDGSDSLAFWLVRGTGEAADVQQTIARLTYTHKSPKTKGEQSVVLDVAPGVDRMMMILICIGLLDEGFEDEHTHPQQ
ncbi:hypothetical protein P3T76_011034 [Phytophthora citrophthora]|uniref:Tubby C-terminal domain-containing protein n=1 Tax=Phytophthora citrophthora TaxID=4793 RepID=A0AAD9G9U4_9STRA|nr:hypothetical protein P3T76_011034 [Phytophthora citrophthora]